MPDHEIISKAKYEWYIAKYYETLISRTALTVYHKSKLRGNTNTNICTESISLSVPFSQRQYQAFTSKNNFQPGFLLTLRGSDVYI